MCWVRATRWLTVVLRAADAVAAADGNDDA